MTHFYTKFRTAYSLSAKAALLSASAFCVSACVTSYAGATHYAGTTQAAPIQSVAANIADMSSPQTLGLISAQTPALSPIALSAPTLATVHSEKQSLDRAVTPSYSAALSAETATVSQEPTALAFSPMPALPVAAQSPSSIDKPTIDKSTRSTIVKMAEAQTAKPMDAEPMRSEKLNSGKMEMTEMKPERLNSEKTMTNSAPQTQSPMNALLGQYVKAPDAMGVARFDYAGLKASQSDQTVLADYIKTLEAKDPSTLSAAEATAYWANLYNAVTIKVVIDNYPVKSIKEIRSGAFSAGPWKKKLTTVNGNPMTLDEIEHETLRKKYPSPLIHYMVNCASIGCPNLKNSLWEARTLDADREAAAREFVNSSRGAKVTSKGLVVSSIYDWFQEDFGGSKAGVLAHLSQYATGDLKAAIDGGAKIKSFDYDWALNE